MPNHRHDPQPSPWVTRFATLIAAGGDVLDLACGAGRHARWLAERGFLVEAVDRDSEVLAALRGVAGLSPRQADLEGGPWPYHGRAFAGIVVTNYLWRPLLPNLLMALAPGGVLIYETFMVGQERLGKPSSPAYLLRKNELLDLVKPRMTVVAFEQGVIDVPQPAAIQRICAIRESAARLPNPLAAE